LVRFYLLKIVSNVFVFDLMAIGSTGCEELSDYIY